jgi:hypothetical protein
MNKEINYLRLSFWAVRLIYIVLFVIVCWIHSDIKYGKNVVIRSIEYVTYYSGNSRDMVDVTIQTENEKVTTESGERRLAKLKSGDTISIYYNYFNKPVYISRPRSEWAFPLVNHLMSYGIIMFATLLSLPMNGEEKFEKYFLWLVWYADIGAIAIYFLT